MTTLNTATLTVAGWINRNGTQAASAALFFERSGSTIRSGFGFHHAGQSR